MLKISNFKRALTISALLLAAPTSIADDLTDTNQFSYNADVDDALEFVLWSPKALERKYGKYYRGHITIKMRDDYENPIYAITLVQGCEYPIEYGRGCVAEWMARKVSIPLTPSRRFRSAAFEFESNIAKLFFKNPNMTLNQLVAKQGVIWKMADVGACEGVLEHVEKINDIPTMPFLKKNQYGDLGFETEMFLHADNFQIISDALSVNVSIQPEPQSPHWEWAAGLVQLLDPCWQTNKEPPPWEVAEDTPVPVLK